MRQLQSLFAFNRGLVSNLGLARVDQKRIALAAQTMNNWMPRVLGSMALRPGLQYLGATASNAAARFLPFVFSTSDTALVELTDSTLRIWKSDALVSRASVASAITNGTFTSNTSGWTCTGSAIWVTGGYLGISSNGTAIQSAYQLVSVGIADRNVQHALNITVARGPVVIRAGSTLGGDEYITQTTLGTGYHSLTLTPTGDFYVQLQSTLERQVLVDSIAIAGSGAMTLTTPWPAASLDAIRVDQSADVLFLACTGYQQRRIERRSNDSWSIVTYQPEDGPFRIENTGATTITASALSGNITLTASAALFRSTHVGALFRVTSLGQKVTVTATAENTFTSAIEITGVGDDRAFTLVITGLTGTGSTVTLQRSLGVTGIWVDMATTYTANQSTTITDGLDNQTAFYRIGVKTGGYSSGTIIMTLQTAFGSITGVARITTYTTSTLVSAEVFSAMGGTTATDVWAEGEWSDYRGWPSCVGFHEGRLWWAGKGGIWGSESDGFDAFNPDTVGDSASINRDIGSGPVDTVNWIVSIVRMILGAQGAEISARSSSLDEPLTPSNFNLKSASTQGSAAVQACRIDQRAVYVQRGGVRIFEVAFNNESYDYGSNDLTAVVPELGSPGITRMAVQRQPDTRIHCIRSDGTAVVGIFDRTENVLCWLTCTSAGASGLIEDVVVLPSQANAIEDQVYYVVKRTINGATVRYLEKWAKETECRGSTLNKQADAFITYTGAPTNVITNLSHLEGASAIVWADGEDLSPGSDSQTTYTVTSGQITLSAGVTVSNAVVGLGYTGQWKSTKLGYATDQLPSPLNEQKKVTRLGLVAAYMHAKGLRYGPDFSTLRELPGIEGGTLVDPDTVHTDYDEEPVEFEGQWNTDTELCLQAQAPRPVTLLAANVGIDI